MRGDNGLGATARFLLQEGFTDEFGKKHREICYVADFQFIRVKPDHMKDDVVVCDVKGVETQAFKIKAKLFQKQYPTYKFEIYK